MKTAVVLKTYYRLTKPGIIYGNLVTAAAGFLLASRHHFDAWLMVALLGGLALVIGAAGVFNNYIDRGIDKKMRRTQSRALAAGVIRPITALIFGGLLAVFGFIILGFFTNRLAFAVVLLALFFYVVVYGFAKRRTIHSTLIGTLPGAAPPAAGYITVTGRLDRAAIILFLILVFWQMAHFYAIGMYRYKDYKAAGLPILPVIKGPAAARPYIMAYITAFIAAAAALTALNYTGYLYLLAIVGLGIYWLGWGLKNYELSDELWGKKMFLISLIVSLGISALVAFGAWLP